MPMLQPVASTSPCTVPGLMSAAVRLMLSRTKPVGVQAANALLDAQIVKPNTDNGNAKRECNFMTSLPLKLAPLVLSSLRIYATAARQGVNNCCRIAADSRPASIVIVGCVIMQATSA